MNRLTVGLLHPGQMGAAVGAQARAGGARVLWCPTDRSAASARRAGEAGFEPELDLDRLIDECPVLLSICPPAGAEDLAARVAQHGFRGVFVDANAVSPDRLTRIAGKLAGAGARVVDGAIFGPVSGDPTVARIYLSGADSDVARVAGLFDGTLVDAVVMPRGIGAASMLKMAHGSYQKAGRVLAAVAHALAARYGVTEQLLDEAVRMAGLPLAEPERLPSVAARAWRWGPEMIEIADTLAAAQLPDEMARAASGVLHCWESDRDDLGVPLPVLLDRLLRVAAE